MISTTLEGRPTVVWLVHQTHHDFTLIFILAGKLTPDVGEIFRIRAAFTNESSFPAGIVVDVKDTVCSSLETSLDQLVIFGGVCRVQSTTKYVANEVLPSYRQPVDIQFVVGCKVCHLCWTIWIAASQRGGDPAQRAVALSDHGQGSKNFWHQRWIGNT